MVGVAAGFAFGPVVSRHLPYRSATSTAYASVASSSFSVSSSSSSRSMAARRGRPKRFVAVARYSSYGSDEDDEEEGGGRNRAPEQEQDPALDIERITSSTVRLLDAKKDMAILSLDGDPPVLRLFEEKEYKKHKYEQQKKKRVQQKRSVAKRMGLKELKMGYNIDIHDYSVRLRAAKKFLKSGDKVKIVVNLKGRENLYKKQAIELLRRFQTDVGELATEGSKNFAERNIYLILVPNKLAIQKEQDGVNKKDSAEGEVDQSEDESDADEAVIEQLEDSSLGGGEPVIEQLEESKEPETEVSANV
ncbi:unnamed protein product [Alopecurus aequalis]